MRRGMHTHTTHTFSLLLERRCCVISHPSELFSWGKRESWRPALCHHSLFAFLWAWSMRDFHEGKKASNDRHDSQKGIIDRISFSDNPFVVTRVYYIMRGNLIRPPVSAKKSPQLNVGVTRRMNGDDNEMFCRFKTFALFDSMMVSSSIEFDPRKVFCRCLASSEFFFFFFHDSVASNTAHCTKTLWKRDS